MGNIVGVALVCYMAYHEYSGYMEMISSILFVVYNILFNSLLHTMHGHINMNYMHLPEATSEKLFHKLFINKIIYVGYTCV